jgi:TPR repeat protein
MQGVQGLNKMNKNPTDNLVKTAFDLWQKGNLDGAATIFEEILAGGINSALIWLSDVERHRGRKKESRIYLAKAEELAINGNAQIAFDLSTTYHLGGGRGNFEEKNKKSIKCLHMAAEFGHPLAPSELANRYFLGSSGLPRDYDQYLKWIWKAIEQGSLEAALDHAQNLLRDKGLVDSKFEQIEKYIAPDQRLERIIERIRKRK